MPRRRRYPDAVISADVYDVQVALFFSVRRMRKYLEWQGFDKLDELGLHDPVHGRALHLEDPRGYQWYYLLFPQKKTHVATVAHECLHIAHAVFKEFGIDSDYANDEHLAYFLGHLVKETTAVFRTRKDAKLEV